MKKLILLIVLTISMTFTSFAHDIKDWSWYGYWWKTATVYDVKALLDMGADVNARDDDDYRGTVLMWASIYNKNPEVIELLLDNGSDINARDDYYGRTALMWASEYNKNPEIIKLLLDNGADINAKDDDGKIALLFASAYNKNPEVSELLYKYESFWFRFFNWFDFFNFF